MSNTTTAALVGVGIFAILLVGGLAWYVRDDGPRLAGAAIGGVLGLLNIAIALPLTLRALRRDAKSVMRAIVGGFLTNLLVVVALTIVFHKNAAVNATAFALTYVTLFFVFDGAKVVLVEKMLRRTA
ncbi:MAG: hypothetical protein ACYTGZ_03830 [Planctomycetota bacterium]